MAVRRIPSNVQSLTGQFNGQEFESSLERDLLLLVHFDEGVEWYETQPVTIKYIDKATGKERKYTPDLLIMYHTDGEYGERKPLLCEVKYREDLAGQWKKLKPKIKAARAYAREYGWVFKILTEVEIRTPYLENVKFLLNHLHVPFDEKHCQRLSAVLHELNESDPRSVIQAAYSDETQQGEALWTLWAMVAHGWVQCDLDSPLSMSTRIWGTKR